LPKITSGCRWTEASVCWEKGKESADGEAISDGSGGSFFFAWGSIFLARMSVLYLAPFIASDPHLSHAQVGLLASALALTSNGSSGAILSKMAVTNACI
jgi:hypothetical protein